MLRRALLAASASGRIRQILTTAPVTRDVVARFVAGDTADDALAVTRRLLDEGLLVSLDYLGEDTVDPQQAAAVTQEYVRLLGRLRAAGMSAGGRAEVSVKATAVGLDLAEHGEKTARENIARICAAAREAGTTVTVDAEEHTRVEPALRILAQLRPEFPDLGCVIQSYLRRSPDDCRALATAGSRVRLCKGAYSAAADVAFTARAEVDRCYARCLRRLIDGSGYPMLATHDPRLIAIAGAAAATAGSLSQSFAIDFIEAMTEALGIEKAIYVGCSMGGHLAPDLALARPGLFRAVIAVEGGLATHDPEPFLEYLSHPRTSNEAKAGLMLGQMSPHSPEQFRRETAWVYSQGGPQVFRGDLDYYLGEHDLTHTASKIDTSKTQVHVISGDYDWSATPERSRALADAIKGATYTQMEGMGHFPMSEHPEAFKKYLTKLLATIMVSISAEK